MESMVSVRGGASEGCPKLLSLKEDTPLLALPDSVELLPSRPDWGLVGEAGMGWRGDCKRKRGQVRVPLPGQTMVAVGPEDLVVHCTGTLGGRPRRSSPLPRLPPAPSPQGSESPAFVG